MARIARLPHFAGVILACGCLIGMLGFGPRSGMGFLLTPMSSAHSWGRDVFALALAIQMLLWGAAQPFAGAPKAGHLTSNFELNSKIQTSVGGPIDRHEEAEPALRQRLVRYRAHA